MKIKLLNDRAKVPTKGSIDAAGYDLYCAEVDERNINPGNSILLSTGIATEIPKGYVGLIFPRSGLGVKQNLRLANGTGVIDSDYRGEWKVCLYNDSQVVRTIQPGDRIAQVVFLPYASFDFETVDSLDETERGDGGFGHSGMK